MFDSIDRLLGWTRTVGLACILVSMSGPRPLQADAPATPATERPELVQLLRSGRLGFDTLLLVRRQPIRPSHVYTYHCEGLKPGGGLYLYHLKTGRLTRLVDASAGVILDADLHPDGRTILFSWKQTMDRPFHLFTIRTDGSDLRQLTDGPHHNFNGCWLPDGGIAFLSTRVSRFAYCWSSPAGILHRMQPDGSAVRQLSANYLNDFTPAVLHDGRIIYARWEYVDRPAIPIQSLWSIHPDGTGLRVFFGNRTLSPATFMEPRPIPGSNKILCVLTAHNGPCRGAIGIIDPSYGVNAQQAITNLTPEINIGQVDRGSGNHVRGPYQSPCPLDENYFLVSRNGELQIRDYAGRHFATVLPPDGPLGNFNAQPLRPRPAGPIHRSALPPAVLADAEDPAADDPDTVQWATVFLQDVYQGLTPHVRPGQVKAIRVVEEIAKPISVNPSRRLFGFQFPVVSCGATYAPKRIWGTAQVLPDGSACFRVPANRPIYFMALDEHGRALQRMRSFTHLMPGEVQGCIGCHEHRSSAVPVTGRPLALSRPPQNLRPPSWGVSGFSYPDIVQPVLDKHCVSCHNAINPPAGLDLTGDKTEIFNVSYEHLARKNTPAEDPRRGGARSADFRNPYTKWISTYNGSEDDILRIEPRHWGSPASKLADVILAGHPDPDGRPRVHLTADEQRRIFAWIDCNVPYYPTSASYDIDRPGCRMIYPPDLDKTLADVARRRCAGCHQGGKIPRTFYTRITNPQYNSFLLAPLARQAGGTQRCGKAVFADTHDPDYQRILRTFDAVDQAIEKAPRWDINPRHLPPPDPACPDACAR